MADIFVVLSQSPSTRPWRRCTGDNVYQALADCPGLGHLVRHAEPDLLAEAHLRTDGRPTSGAQATGWV
jgi:hypothetical protein